MPQLPNDEEDTATEAQTEERCSAASFEWLHRLQRAQARFYAAQILKDINSYPEAVEAARKAAN